MSKELSLIHMPINDLKIMAEAFVKSKLFGIQTVEQALTLFFIAQADGVHPATAAKDYHIINGKPALKADAMLARFQAAGGKVEWKSLTDTKVAAIFSHPQGGDAEIDWDMNRAKKSDLSERDNWKKYPRAMLRSRVISEGIRTVFPGVVVGTYTPEEVHDFDTIEGEVIKSIPLSSQISPSMTVEEKKELYLRAESALENVNDFDSMTEWANKYQLKLSQNLAPERLKIIIDKAQSKQNMISVNSSGVE